MLQLIDDAVELDLLAGVLLPLLRPRRQHDFELFSLGAVEQHLHVLLGQILEGRIEAESVVCGETIAEAGRPNYRGYCSSRP